MITVNELLQACQAQVAKGNGDKFILLSVDDDVTTAHPCNYVFSEDVWEFTDPNSVKPRMSEEQFNNCVLLG